MNPFSPTTSLVMASCKLCGGLTGSELPSSVSLVLAPGAMAQPSQKCKPSRASWECLPFRSHRASALLCSRQNAPPPPFLAQGQIFCHQGPVGSQVTQSPLRKELLQKLEVGCWETTFPKRKPKPWFVVFADFCGVNIPRAAGFKPPV